MSYLPLYKIFYFHQRISKIPGIASYCIQLRLIQYLIIFPYVHNPAVYLVNFRELPVDSVPSWRDTSRADLPLACSQPQPRICSLFLPYNKQCGPDYINRPGQQSLPTQLWPSRLLVYAHEFTVMAETEKQLDIFNWMAGKKHHWTVHTFVIELFSLSQQQRGDGGKRQLRD